jgi:hypothetical protein
VKKRVWSSLQNAEGDLHGANRFGPTVAHDYGDIGGFRLISAAVSHHFGGGAGGFQASGFGT